METKKYNILVTGFGPFKGHPVNASWESVKLLRQPQYEISNYTIIAEEIPVEYKYIEEQIKQLWNKYDPKLVVHVGVSHCAKTLTLETNANRTGYYKADICNEKHRTGECCSQDEGDDTIYTTLKIDEICKNINVNDSTCAVKAEVSNDAGRYLCEFLYYQSLCIDRTRTLFIHVPILENPYSAEELADGIHRIITSAIEQMQ